MDKITLEQRFGLGAILFPVIYGLVESKPLADEIISAIQEELWANTDFGEDDQEE